jgi:hypothetical protein
MIIGVKETISESGNGETPPTNTTVQDLGLFLTLHFDRLENFFNLMDRSQGNGCRTCEFSSVGRLVLQRFKVEAEEVRGSIERAFGPIHIARRLKQDDILGVIPARSRQREGSPNPAQTNNNAQVG